MESKTSIYDQNDYYLHDERGSRLAGFLGPLLNWLDWLKARQAGALSPEPGNALDVGAGDGKFLHFLRRGGWKIWGTTASQTSQKAASRLYGIDLYFGKTIPESFAARTYQLITYWHVFEHLENPLEHAVQWAKLLDQKGTLVLEFPNIESIGARLNYRCWLGSDPLHHINHQKPEDIQKFVEAHGLRIHRTETFSLKFSFVFLWSALLGFVFGQYYEFDSILELLKNPLRSLKKRPFLSLNAILSLGYFFPFVLILTLYGCLRGKGEVVRFYAGH